MWCSLQRSRALLAFVFGLLLALAIASCGDSTSSSPLVPGLPGSVVLDVAPHQLMLAVGDTATVAVTAVDASGHVKSSADIQWSVSNPKVLRVNQGRVQGLAAGSSDITVAFLGRSASVEAVVTGDAASVEVASGDQQTAPAGDALTTPLSVRVLDVNGMPVGGAVVRWTVTAGGGAVSSDSTMTDSEGLASTTWTLGESAGTQTVEASVAGADPVAFSAWAGQAAVVSVAVAPDHASLAVGAQVQLTATALDANGSAAEGLAWSWSSSKPSVASVSGTGLVVAKGSGTATITASAGGRSGTASITVTSVATGSPGLQVVSGGDQSGTVGKSLPSPLVVELRDPQGVPVQGATITWSASGNGSTAASSTTTDEGGRAQVTWTLGTVAGAQQATATAAGGTVTFAATARPGPAASITVKPASPSVSVGQTVAFDASGVDAYGNQLDPRWVWSTDNSGIATVTAQGVATGVSPGTVVIRAWAGGGSGQASLTVQDTPASLILSQLSGDAQTGAAGTTLGQPLQVKVRNAQGTGVGGVAVHWTVTAGGGSVASATTTTDGQGLASVRWTLGSTAGVQTVRAEATGAGSVAFTATSVSGVVKTVTVSPASASVGLGGTQTFTAVARDAMGNVVSGAPTWSSSNTTLASVNASGTATGLAAGTVEIRATQGGVTGKATLNVSSTPAPKVASVVASPASYTFTALGQSYPFTATARDSAGKTISGVTFTWTSTNTSVATVDAMGRVTTKAVGTALIIVAAASHADTVAVTATQVPKTVVVSPSSVSLEVGGTRQLSAVVKDANGYAVSAAAVTWASMNPSVASVSPGGLATAKAAGIAQIEASSGGLKASAIATVNSPTSPKGGAGPIYRADFSGGVIPAPANGFGLTGGSANVTVESDIGGFGGSKYALRFFYNGKDKCKDSTAQMNFSLAKNTREIWMRWVYYYPSGKEGIQVRKPEGAGGTLVPLNRYFHRYPKTDPVCLAAGESNAHNNKWLRLWGPRGYGNKYNGWGFSTYSTGDGDSQMKAEIPLDRRDPGPLPVVDPLITDSSRGRWVEFELHAKLGATRTEGLTVQLKVDGRTVFDRNGLALWDDQEGWDQGYLLGWADSGFAVDTPIYLGLFEIYTSSPGWAF